MPLLLSTTLVALLLACASTRAQTQAPGQPTSETAGQEPARAAQRAHIPQTRPPQHRAKDDARPGPSSRRAPLAQSLSIGGAKAVESGPSSLGAGERSGAAGPDAAGPDAAGPDAAGSDAADPEATSDPRPAAPPATARPAGGQGKGQPACVTHRKEVRYGNAGYDHIVEISNACKRSARCTVTTSANPEGMSVNVPAGRKVELVTFRGSPARSFTADVACRLRS